MKPVVAITMGDPCGIGPEVIVKGLMDGTLYEICRPFVIGEYTTMRDAAAQFSPEITLSPIGKVAEAIFHPRKLDILTWHKNEPDSTLRPFQPGLLNPDAAKAALKAIDTAASLALSGKVDAIATAPINKENMKQIGFAFPGHTEFFARKSKARQFGMMMVGGNLKIMLASIHLPLKEAIAQLNPVHLLETIQLTDTVLKQDFGIACPHIAIAGLNPHAGERGILGQEEESAVMPAIEAAQKEELHVTGPYPADTLFYKLQQQRFDAAVALYHDQALIPIKLIAFGCAVNLTAGLPFIRTSVDHGTAFDIAGKGLADPGSLKAAVRLAANMASHRFGEKSKTSKV